LNVDGATAGDLQDKVVLVSGGTQGVGAAVARAALLAGASVVITGRRVDVGEAAAAELRSLGGNDVRFVPTDIADVEQARESVRQTVEWFGRVDCLVNAAGLTSRGTLLDTTPELFDQHVAVNLRGPFFLMQAAVQDMRRRAEPGTIVNVITMSAHGGHSYLAPYVAAKAGMVGLTRNAAHAHRWDRIRINGINIGWTDTEGEDATQRAFHGAGDDWRAVAGKALPMGRLGQVDDAAALAVLLLSERSGVVTGSVIDWDQQVVGAYD
jgi:NAD(P)-dependent dehydrogenase (short-subunit alcohol dehydrogenase family)